MPGPDVIGNAATAMKHVSIGKKAMRGTEEETLELRKMLYGGNTLYGNYTVWATLTPNDETDALVAAAAGYTFGPTNRTTGAAGSAEESTTDPTAGNEQQADVSQNANPPSSLKEYSRDDMAEAVANDPVACARAFRKQVEIYVLHILGWDLKTGMSHEGIMSLVQAFSLQVTPLSHISNPYFTR